jgi:ATP-dependent 26S proteasome regulatory subunit
MGFLQQICRFMVNLCDSSNREKILRIILADGHLSQDIDLKAMADITIDIPAVILRFFFLPSFI